MVRHNSDPTGSKGPAPNPGEPATPAVAGSSTEWSATLSNLLTLARQANSQFGYDKALSYLADMEEIFISKTLPDISLSLRLEMHQERGKALASKGKIEQAVAEYKKTLDLCRDSSHLKHRSETFTQVGQLLAKQGDYDRALGYLQRAIGAYRRLKDNAGICRALRNLGVIYVQLGEFEEAEITYDEAIELANEIEDRLLYADMVNNLGTIMNMKGSWERALELYRESHQIYREVGEIRKSAYTENNIGITLNERGHPDEALQYFENAYRTGQSIKDSALTLIIDINLADLHLKLGELERAQRHCIRAEKHLTDADMVNGHLVEVRKIAGIIARVEGDHETAMQYLNDALEIGRQIGAQFLEADVLLERGILFREMDRLFDALGDLESSYHLYASLKAEGRREQTEETIGSIERLYLSVFNDMAQQVDQKDPYTKGHSDRVASLALLLGRELGLRTSQLKTIVAASLLHDIGKIKIDDQTLKKKGRLSKEEFEHIKGHPQLGVDLLAGKEFPWDIKPLILHHHEKLSGAGYPHGLSGDDIPLGARIICIADVFDALTSDRVYRSAYDAETALSIMAEESGSSFDSVLLTTFIDLIKCGAADLVINSRTSRDELYSIWSQCMGDTGSRKAASGQRSVARSTATR